MFGRIKLIHVCSSSAVPVYFVTEKCRSVFFVDQGVHCFRDPELTTLPYLCIAQEKLLDYYPLPEYNVFGQSIVALHHSFPGQE